MGSELHCTVQFNGARSEGKALLETDVLRFRGDFRLSIPHKTISALDVADGRLHVTFPEGTAVFELGVAAVTWAEKIRNPRALLDKLGVRPGMRVAVLGIRDERFLSQVAERIGDIARRTPKQRTDLIFLGADSVAALSRLRNLKGYLVPNGAIWVVHPKGKGAPFRDVDVFTAAKRAGLVDTKVASFSATHTAEKLVIPVAARPSSSSRAPDGA